MLVARVANAMKRPSALRTAEVVSSFASGIGRVSGRRIRLALPGCGAEPTEISSLASPNTSRR
jgi:hypothetical protein